MDSNHDADARIAQLENELTELRGERPKATRIAPQPAMPRRRLPAFWIAASLFALSLPVATYIHGEARSAQMSKLQRRALHTEARLSLAERRHDIATRFLDVALDPDRSGEDRAAALRYLADQLGAKSKLRRWAKNELARGSAGATSCAKKKAAKAKAVREALAREQQAELQQTAGRSCG